MVQFCLKWHSFNLEFVENFELELKSTLSDCVISSCSFSDCSIAESELISGASWFISVVTSPSEHWVSTGLGSYLKLILSFICSGKKAVVN